MTLGFNVPQTGAYADEGADEQRAYRARRRAPQRRGRRRPDHDLQPSKALKGNGILGKKVVFVTGDTQTKADAARDRRQAA